MSSLNLPFLAWYHKEFFIFLKLHYPSLWSEMKLHHKKGLAFNIMGKSLLGLHKWVWLGSGCKEENISVYVVLLENLREQEWHSVYCNDLCSFLYWFFKLILLFMLCVFVFACMSLCTTHACKSPQRPEKGKQNYKLLWPFIWGTGNWTWVLYKSSKCC